MFQNNYYKNFVQKYLNIKYYDLDEKTIESGKKILIDSIACALSGFKHPFYLKIQKIAQCNENDKHAIWGTDRFSSRNQAVFLNAICMSVMDFEDTDDGVPMHITSILLPVIFSEYEKNIDIFKYEDFITAFCVGIESSIRLGRAGNVKGTKGWNWGAICASYGSIIAVGHLLRWPVDHTLNCLGHLLLQQGGSLQAVYELKESMRLQAGYASTYCSNAIMLTQENIDSVSDCFSGRAGLFQIFQSGDFNMSTLEDFSSQFQYTQNLSLKKYPSCRFTHAAVDCAIDAYTQGIRINDIQHIEVFATKQTINMVGQKVSENLNLFESQFNLSYLITLALHNGKINTDILLNNSVQHQILDEFSMEKIHIKFNEVKEGFLPFYLHIYLNNGEKYDFFCESLSGSKDKPLGDSEIEQKFTSCLKVGKPLMNSKNTYSSLINLKHGDRLNIISEIFS